MNKAVFLDRDGTLNVEVDYLHECGKLRLIEGTAKALRILKEEGYLLIVISNQSGVGRGYFTSDDVDKVNDYMNALLDGQGAALDAFYYCPHTEKDNCRCRKPKTGLYLKAAKDFDIDFKQSYMAGDKETDILASFELGTDYALLMSGHDIEQEILEKYKGHCYAKLLDFAEYVKRKNHGNSK